MQPIRRTVVGAALVQHGLVLSARRTAPAEAAGRWEFPGGKVEPGESPDEALAREIEEELGCRVAIDAWLPGEVPIGDHHLLRVAVVHLVAGAPRPREHDAIRWLAADELDDVDWLEPDRPFLPLLAARLRAPIMGTMRGIFFEEEHARAVVERLTREGYAAELTRERLAGEDDDEDHPWAVLSDAPEAVLDLLVEQYDGWLDLDELDRRGGELDRRGGELDHRGTELDHRGDGPAAPLELPTQPRRIKRPPTGPQSAH